MIALREGPVQWRKNANNYGGTAQNLWRRNQTSRSPKGQCFCTGGAERFCVSSNKEIAKICEKSRNCGNCGKPATRSPPSPPSPCVDTPRRPQ